MQERFEINVQLCATTRRQSGLKILLVVVLAIFLFLYLGDSCAHRLIGEVRTFSGDVARLTTAEASAFSDKTLFFFWAGDLFGCGEGAGSIDFNRGRGRCSTGISTSIGRFVFSAGISGAKELFFRLGLLILSVEDNAKLGVSFEIKGGTLKRGLQVRLFP